MLRHAYATPLYRVVPTCMVTKAPETVDLDLTDEFSAMRNRMNKIRNRQKLMELENESGPA